MSGSIRYAIRRRHSGFGVMINCILTRYRTLLRKHSMNSVVLAGSVGRPPRRIRRLFTRWLSTLGSAFGMRNELSQASRVRRAHSAARRVLGCRATIRSRAYGARARPELRAILRASQELVSALAVLLDAGIRGVGGPCEFGIALRQASKRNTGRDSTVRYVGCAGRDVCHQDLAAHRGAVLVGLG